MHSYIVQISETEIEKEDYIDSLIEYSYELLDYTSDTTESEREEVIKHIFGGGMFPENTFTIIDDTTIEYHGCIGDMFFKWIEDIKTTARNLNEDNVFKSVQYGDLFKITQNALKTDMLFQISNEKFGCLEKSTALFEFVMGLCVGQRFYVGGVLNCH